MNNQSDITLSNGECRFVIQPIAIKLDGTRVPMVERQCDKYLHAPEASPTLLPP